MAYGLNWFSEFDDLEGKPYRVEILRRDYSGEPIEVLSGSAPIKFSWMDDAVNDPFHPTRTQRAEIEWISDENSNFEISQLFITDEQEYKVLFGEINPNTEDFSVKWQGYLVATDCREPFASKPYTVDLSASCSLSILRDLYFLDEDGKFVEGVVSLFNIVRMCLAQTNLNLGIDVSLGLREAVTGNPVVLSQTYIDVDGLRGMKAFDVLSGILMGVRGYITQEDSRWVIKAVPVLQSDNVLFDRYTYDGAGYSAETLSQISTIGRNALPGIPNLRPKSQVEESIAEPFSIATNAVSPGIPVNRLNNGTFNPSRTPWVVNLSAMSSWSASPEPLRYGVEGSGKPDDPYRYEMVGSVKSTGDLVYRTNLPKQENTHISNSTPIFIHSDEVNGALPNLKIVVSGAFRARDGVRLMILCRLNQDDRDIVAWLDETGKWTDEKYKTIRQKAFNRHTIKVTVDNPHDPTEYHQLADMPLQTFEVTSSKLSNYLYREGEWVAKLYFSIYPITVGADSFPEVSNQYSPALSLEDISVYITTDIAFEVEHYYEIDGKKLIRNADDYEYTSIIADKIDILTSEQRLPENRVMTGYMTIGSTVLSEKWQRSVNGSFTGDPEPLQHLTLRETLRLLCGKRRVIEGKFYGEGLKISGSVKNQYDEDNDYYTITSYAWDVKQREYTIRLHQLNFDPLEEEVISLLKERRDNGRGNRLYRGGSGSNSSGNGGDGSGLDGDPILLDDIPTVYFTVGEFEIKQVKLGDLILSDHDPEVLDTSIEHYDFPILVQIDRGVDEDELNIVISAKPAVPGRDTVLVELQSLDGAKTTAVINIVAIPATKFTHYLIDTSGGETVVGKLKAGSGYLKPDSWKIRTVVDGLHDGYSQSVSGPGVSASTAPPYVEVAQTSDGTYTIPPSSAVGDVGIYNYNFDTYRNDGDPDLLNAVKSDDFNFTLFDEAYLNKCKFELWVGGSKFGDIAPDGSSAFNTEGQAFQIKIIVDGVEHDEAYATLLFEGAAVQVTEYNQDPSVTDITYDLYSPVPSPQPKGYYELTFEASEENVQVYSRMVGFTINKKKEAPEGGQMSLVAMRSGQTAYDVMGTLDLNGNLFDLPADGWSVLNNTSVVAGTTRSHKIFQERGNLVDVDTSLYTGAAQSKTYLEDIDDPEYLIFGGLSSKLIDKIHANNTSFRVIITDEVAGEITQVLQGDFSFGTLKNLDDLEVEEPGAVTYVPGHATGATTVNNVTAFNWRPDNVGLEVFEPESPDVSGGGVNHARIKNKGVTYPKFQDMPAKTVLGNPTGATGVTSAIKIADVVEGADPGDVITVSYIEQLIGEAIDGTAGYIPKFGGDGIVDSIIREVSGNIGVGVNPTQKLHVAGNVLVTGQLQSAVGTGTAPLVVASTTLVTNLNADLLDGQHGPYYLDWNNFTNYKSIIAGNGLITGGPLDDDVTLNLGTPGTITPLTTNSVSTDSHTHAITGIYTESEIDIFLGLKADKTTTVAVNGTSGRITSSAGAQNLSTNRSWTLDLATTGVGAGDYNKVTVDAYGRVTGGSNPTTLSGHGITNSYTKSEVDALIAGIDTGLGGSGTAGYFAVFTSGSSLGNGSMWDVGDYINISKEILVNGSAIVQGSVTVDSWINAFQGIQFSNASEPASAAQGMLYSSGSQLRYYTGSVWRTIQMI